MKRKLIICMAMVMAVTTLCGTTAFGATGSCSRKAAACGSRAKQEACTCFVDEDDDGICDDCGCAETKHDGICDSITKKKKHAIKNAAREDCAGKGRKCIGKKHCKR